MKLCPRCNNIVGFNSYFGAYICSNCKWRDDTVHRIRQIEYLLENSSTLPLEHNKKLEEKLGEIQRKKLIVKC